MRLDPRVGKALVALLFGLAMAAPGQAAPDGERIVLSDIAGPEGPVEAEGTLYLVSSDDGQLLRWDGKGNLATILNQTPDCGHNGLARTSGGSFLLACMEGDGAILELAADGHELRRWTKDDRGRPFTGGVNDIALAADGGVYATLFGAADHQGGVLYRAPGSANWARVADGLNRANGIAVSADRKTLYVGESVGNRILAFAIATDGRLGAPAEFVRLGDLVRDRIANHWLGPDGIKVDRAGNLYVAQYLGAKIIKLSPRGTLLHVFDIAAGARVTNLALTPDESAFFATVVDCGGGRAKAAGPTGCVVRVANSD